MKKTSKVKKIEDYNIEHLPLLGESRDDMEYSYSCAMVDLSKEYADIIRYWGKKMIKSSDVFKNADVKGYDEIPHVTLKYGIHDSNKTCMDNIITDYDSIKVKLGKVTKFDNEDFDVIKIDVSGDDLFSINKKISSELKCTDTFPTYEPHVTIAYVKKGTCDHLLDNDFFDNIEDEITEITFSSKDGSECMIPLGDK